MKREVLSKIIGLLYDIEDNCTLPEELIERIKELEIELSLGLL